MGSRVFLFLIFFSQTVTNGTFGALAEEYEQKICHETQQEKTIKNSIYSNSLNTTEITEPPPPLLARQEEKFQ